MDLAYREQNLRIIKVSKGRAPTLHDIPLGSEEAELSVNLGFDKELLDSSFASGKMHSNVKFTAPPQPTGLPRAGF